MQYTVLQVAIRCYCLFVSTIILTVTGSQHEFSQCATHISCRCSYISITNLAGVLADCSNLELHYSPTFTSSVVSVNLSHNFLSSIPEEDLLPNGLLYLDLSYNNISNFSTNNSYSPFASSTQLLGLNLSNNNISLDVNTYFKGVFINLQQLQHLDISYNSNDDKSYYCNDAAFEDLQSLQSLYIDAVKNVTFGTGFLSLKNMSSLRTTGICTLAGIKKNYFENFPHLKSIDISARDEWRDIYNCTLYTIEIDTFKNISHLEYLDISYHRQLGLCGLRDVINGLPKPLKVLKAQYLACETGGSVQLYIGDIKKLRYSNLTELYIDGNNLDKASDFIIQFMPETLQTFSATDNRWVVDRYAYRCIEHLTGIKTINLSFQNKNQMSHSTGAMRCIDSFSQGCQCFRRDREETIGNCTKVDEIGTWKVAESGNCNISGPITSCIEYSYGDCWSRFQLAMIPPNTETLILDNARAGYLIVPLYFSTTTVKTLILRNNQLYAFTGPMCNLSSLEYLDLSGNRATEISTYVFGSLPNLKFLGIDNNILGSSDLFKKDQSKLIFDNQSNLVCLNMSTNRIQAFNRDIFRNLIRIKSLILDNNLLTDWNVTVSHMTYLQILNLSNNEIFYLSATGMTLLEQVFKGGLTVDLSNNPFQCSCESFDFFKWLSVYKGYFHAFDSYTCSYKSEQLSIVDVMLNLEKNCNAYPVVILLTACLILIFLFIVASVVAYRYRWRLRYWYYIVKGAFGYHRFLNKDDFQFDAFVSYANEDRHFVINDMIEYLEKNKGLKLCIHHRDFIVGCPIYENIVNFIHKSRKIVCVLTDNFLRSDWCRSEFLLAQTETAYSRHGETMTVIIHLKDTDEKNIPEDMKYVIDNDTYIVYPENEDDNDVFWFRLSESLQNN